DRHSGGREKVFEDAELEALLRRKGFLHRIVTGDEKWVHYDNPKRRKSWGDIWIEEDLYLPLSRYPPPQHERRER
ncbi:hypothetical protein ALC57_14787, partial [Trachymyrmex cornetzi]